MSHLPSIFTKYNSRLSKMMCLSYWYETVNFYFESIDWYLYEKFSKIFYGIFIWCTTQFSLLIIEFPKKVENWTSSKSGLQQEILKQNYERFYFISRIAIRVWMTTVIVFFGFMLNDSKESKNVKIYFYDALATM